MGALTPWISLIIAFVGITGTLLASWFGYRYALRIERARWAHEDRTRYNLERIRAYTEFLTAGATALTQSASIRSGSPEQYAALQAARADALRAATIEFHHAYFQTRMLATQPVKDVAEKLFHLTYEPPTEARDERIREIRLVFIDTAQRELGVLLDLPAAPQKK